MSVLKIFFAWPNGQVWPNLLASLIWAAPTVFFTHKKLHKMHKHLETLAKKGKK